MQSSHSSITGNGSNNDEAHSSSESVPAKARCNTKPTDRKKQSNEVQKRTVEKLNEETGKANDAVQPLSGAVPEGFTRVPSPILLTRTEPVANRTYKDAGEMGFDVAAEMYAEMVKRAMVLTMESTPQYLLQDISEVIIEPQFVIHDLQPTVRFKFNYGDLPKQTTKKN